MISEECLSLLILAYPLYKGLIAVNNYRRARAWLRAIRSEIDAINASLGRDPADWAKNVQSEEDQMLIEEDL